jgi:hypothetical protein
MPLADRLAAITQDARTRAARGDLPAARRLLEETLDAADRTLGDAHPLLLLLAYDLGMIADELGNRHEARRNFTRLMRYGPAALGAHHEYVRAAESYLDDAPATAPRPWTTPPGGPPAPPPEPVPPPPVVEPLPVSVYRPDETRTATPPPPLPPMPSGTPRRRGPLLALLLVAVLALAGGAVVAVLAFRATGPRPGAAPPPPPPTSAAAPQYLPPGDLRLRDNSDAVTLTWTDPSHGTAPVVIAGGHADRAPDPLQTLNSGETTYTVNGLSPTTDYCFLVAIVYSPQHVASSKLVCTHRAPSAPGRSPSPSR